jgi:BolA protein
MPESGAFNQAPCVVREIERGTSFLPPAITSMSIVEEIESRLGALNPDSVEIADDSASHAGHVGARSGGGHYDVTVVSARFFGKSRVERHRMVYALLAPLMQRQIHALALRTFAPDEI